MDLFAYFSHVQIIWKQQETSRYLMDINGKPWVKKDQ